MNDAELPPSLTLDAAPPRRKWLFLGGLALLAVGLAGAWYAYLSFVADRRLNAAIAVADAMDPGWRLEELEAKRLILPTAENAGVRVRGAMELLPAKWPAWDYAADDPDAERARQALQASFGNLEPQTVLGEAQIKALRAELEKAAAAVAEGRKVADLPQGRYSIAWSPDCLSTLVPHLDVIRNVARALEYDILLRAQEGDLDGALLSCRAVLNTGRSLGDEPLLISQLVRIARADAALRKVERVLAQGEPSLTALELTQRLFADEAEQPWYLFGVRGERASLDGLLAAVQRGDFSLAYVRSTVGVGSTGLVDSVGTALTSGSIQTNRAAALEFMNEAVAIGRLSAQEQRARAAALEAQARNLPAIARMLCPAVMKVAEAGHRNQALLRCAGAGLAAERFRRDKGRWPTSVAELVPAYLPQPLTDPFDGQPLRLVRVGHGIVIYSVGFDGRDDGGNLDRSNVRAPGTDFGFELWDVPHRRQPPPRSPSPDPENLP
jgi:hypothetical protein